MTEQTRPFVADLSDPGWLTLMFAWPFAAVLWAALAVVRHADALAEQLASPTAP